MAKTKAKPVKPEAYSERADQIAHQCYALYQAGQDEFNLFLLAATLGITWGYDRGYKKGASDAKRGSKNGVRQHVAETKRLSS